MTTELPAPLVPADVDLRDFAFTPMYRARLFGSAFHARATDSEWRAGVTLWLKSQDQCPAGSLPDDDVELARLAELARDLKTWKKIRAGALHGWIKCSDGRLYNPVTAEIAKEQWQGKLDQRHRTMKARVAGLEKRLSLATDAAVKADIEDQLQKLRQALSQHPNQAVTSPVTQPVTGSKREGQGEGQGKGEGLDSRGAARSAHRPRAQGTRLLPEWVLPKAWGEWALTEQPTWTADHVRKTAESFRDYWIAKSGKDATKTDWEATWRNWVRREKPMTTGVAINGKANPSIHHQRDATLAALTGSAGRTIDVVPEPVGP